MLNCHALNRLYRLLPFYPMALFSHEQKLYLSLTILDRIIQCYCPCLCKNRYLSLLVPIEYLCKQPIAECWTQA